MRKSFDQKYAGATQTECAVEFEIVSPVNCRSYATRPYASEMEISAALDAAVATGSEWARRPLTERIAICRRAIEVLCDTPDTACEELTWSMGRPLAQTAGEFHGVLERAEYLLDIAPETLAVKERDWRNSDRVQICREPCGVVLVIAPWNYPYLTTVNSVLPALVAGNSVIIKHAPQTALVAENFCRAFHSAGVPDGALGYLHCRNSDTQGLVADRRIQHVVFTGSVNVGRMIAGIAGQTLKGITLELGGMDAAYVRDDADPAAAAAALAEGAFFNAGQSCCAIERIFVAKPLYREFLNALEREAAMLRLGNPFDDSTTLGPVVSDIASNRIRTLLEEARNRGANVVSPGEEIASSLPASYLSPAVVSGLPSHCRLWREEVFGPVVTVSSVAGDEDAIARINASDFGLTASIWTFDLDSARQLGARLEVGTWFANRCDYLAPCLPWSGRKNSGVGCSLSELGYHALTRPKSAFISAGK